LTDLALSPVAVYILVVAPVLGTIVRAAISRQREFLADADAALLTRFPEGLMRALAKIGGSGSAQPNSNPAFSHFYFSNPCAKKSWFSNTLLATHPRIEDRLQRLVDFGGGAVALPALEAAVRDGRRYAKERAALQPVDFSAGLPAADELAAINRGNPMGRVFRVIAAEPVLVYDDIHPGGTPMVVARIKPGELIVAFDDLGKMRQLNTANETFGYIDRSVKLVPIDNVIPAEIYDAKLRAAVEAKLPPLGATAVRADSQATGSSASTFTNTQIVVAAAVVFLLVLASSILLIMKFAK